MKTVQQLDGRLLVTVRGVALLALVAWLVALTALPSGKAPAAAGDEPEGPAVGAGAQAAAVPVSGDVDCGGELTAADALHILRYVARLPGAPDCVFAADVQCDNDRDAVDALLVLRQVASLPPAVMPPGCPGIGQPLPTNPELAGGVLVSAVSFDESYGVWLTSQTGIEMAYDLAWNRLPWGYQGGLFAGPLRSGPGTGEHNLPWSWHLDPDETVIAEVTIEACQAQPSFVEQDVEAWIASIGLYCPFITELASIVDYRWMVEAIAN